MGGKMLWELRCPKCRGFVSGYPDDPGMVIGGYCHRCPLRFEARAEITRRHLDIASIRVSPFAQTRRNKSL